MRSISYAIILCFLFLGIGLWFAQSYTTAWEPQLRTLIIQRAEKTLHNRVTIEHLSIQRLHGIALTGITVWDNETTPPTQVFRAQQITVTVSLLNLPQAILHHNAGEAIGLIQVDNPWLGLSASQVQSYHRLFSSSPHSAHPLFFTLSWNQGVFQWKDQTTAPYAIVSLYQSRGLFRIRGPKLDLFINGMMDQVHKVQLVFSLLGHHWHVNAHLEDSHLEAILGTLHHLRPNTPWLTALQGKGTFDFDIRTQGNNLEKADLSKMIDSAEMSLRHVEIQPASHVAPFQIDGRIFYRDGEIRAPHLLFGGLITGIGNFHIHLNGTLQNPFFTFQAAIPKGYFLKHPFQHGILSFREFQHHWEFLDNHVDILGGRLSLQGLLSSDSTRLEWTGDNLLLSELAAVPAKSLSGRLHFSLTQQASDSQGSFSITALRWGSMAPEFITGRVERVGHVLNAYAASEDNQFLLDTQLSYQPAAFNLQNFALHLRSGGVLTAQGKWLAETHSLRGTVQAEEIQARTDLPIPPNIGSALQGTISANGQLSGSLDHWLFQGQGACPLFQIGSTSPTPASFSLKMTGQQGSLLSFWTDLHGALSGQVDITKQLSAWNGTLRLHADHLSMGKVLLTEANVEGQIHQHTLAFRTLSLVAPWAKAIVHGEARWETSEELRFSNIKMTLQGEVSSSALPATWASTFRAIGSLHPENAWAGQMDIHTPPILIHDRPTEPAEASIAWTTKEVMWHSVRWGQALLSKGSLHLGPIPDWQGIVWFHALPLAQWEKWFRPTMQEPLDGKVSGTLALSGPMQHPTAQITADVERGRWRAFSWNAHITGTGDSQQIAPLTIDGHLLTGGDFHVEGHLQPQNGTISTHAAFKAVNLSPLGQSLSFPDPLDGHANGTLTVDGPLTRLQVAGHLQGDSVRYGKPNKTPLALKSIAMDFTLEPSVDHTGATRLSFTQAMASTEEEQIRLNPGSYIEFYGMHQAALAMSTELRNVHLGLMTFFGGLDIQGTWQIKPEGIAIHGDLMTRSLYLNAYELSEGHINADYYAGLLSFPPPKGHAALVTGKIDFQHYPQFQFTDFALRGKEQQTLNLSGEIGPEQWGFHMIGHGLDINTLGNLAEFPYALDGTADINIQGSGNLLHPHVQGIIHLSDGQISILHFKTGEANLLWQDNRMTLTHLTLSDPGRYTILGAGVFPIRNMSADRTINFSLRLQNTNLGLLQSLAPEVEKAKGAVEGLLQVQGTLDAPTIQGSLRVINGSVDGAHYFHRLRNFNMLLTFEGNRIVIHNFRGRSGQGQFQGNGRILLSGLTPRYYNLSLSVPSEKGLDVQVPELVIPDSPLSKNFRFLTSISRANVRGHVSFKGPADAPLFSGLVDISNGHFSFPPSSKNPPAPAFTEWIHRILWDLDLKFDEGAWFENELVQANLTGSLHLGGPYEKLKVNGGLDIAEGKISYLGIDFDIQEARFDIRPQENENALTNIPYVRGRAESRVETVDNVSGQTIDDTIKLTIDYAPINQIKPRLVSTQDPTLPADKVISRVTQLDVQNMTLQERNYLYQQQMVRLIDTSLATPLARNLLKRTGLIDELRVSHTINPTNTYLPNDPNNPLNSQQQSAVTLLAGTKYTLSKNVSDRLSLGYGLRFEQYTTTELVNKLDLRSDVEMSYRMVKNVYLKGSFDLPSSTPGALIDRKITIEPRWRFGWWGNTNPVKSKPQNASPNPNSSSPNSP